MKRLPGIEPLAGGLILTMVALIVAGFAVSGYRQTVPVTAGHNWTNPATPVAADTGAVERGNNIFAVSCVACHGPAGAGLTAANTDPAHNHSTSADLTDRRGRLQSDGDLFYAITNGIPGSAMPAYDPALTDAQRWDLVTYLRALQDAARIQPTETP